MRGTRPPGDAAREVPSKLTDEDKKKLEAAYQAAQDAK
jgi:hypothetical protein